MPRDHHLRARRLKLGASQELIGCLADWPVCSAQSMVSNVERGRCKSHRDIHRVRSAIVYLESQPRRQRAWERQDALAADIVETAILLNRSEVIVERMIDLLTEWRGEEFDELSERVPLELAVKAGSVYLDGIHPTFA